ncbi:MAG: hypothetical protein COA58_15275 [Bacteroidetes bacterium]|nr:MAG: hypothetical protein COA58_15275 [Bacteroidota bacterium]
MKLNKSIFGLVVLSIFILSSCSQAKYSSHTRRVKADKIVQSTKKVDRIKRSAGLMEGEKVEDSRVDRTVLVLPKVGSTTLNSEFRAESERLKTLPVEKRSITETKGLKKIRDLAEKSRVAKKIKRVKKHIDSSITRTDDDVDDIVYIILVVILVLLILSLITKLIPAFSYILGIALLILLIYLLLQIL